MCSSVFSSLLAVLLVFCAIPSHAQIAGQAAALNGTNYLRTTLNSAEMFPTRDFTFELWFNASAPGVLIGEVDRADIARWDVAFAELQSDGQIKVGVPGVPAFTIGPVTLGTWHHVALSYREATQTLSASLNGVLSGTSTGVRNQPRDSGRVAVYTFGRGGATNLNNGSAPWYSGAIEEVRIWRVALDAAQIASYWNRILTPEFQNLIAIWHFDTNGGNISPDSHLPPTNPVMYVPTDGAMRASLNRLRITANFFPRSRHQVNRYC